MKLFNRSGKEPVTLLFYALMAALTLITILTFNRYGFTTDEVHGIERAIQVYKFLISGGTSTESVSQFDLLSIYGAMPDVIALFLQKAVPALSFDSRHLIAAFFGLAGIFYIYRIGFKFVGARTGLIAAVFLACNPMWFGYMFINIKDIPFATTLLASIYYGLMGLTGRSKSWPVWLKLGISVGLLITTKLPGPLLLGFMVLVLLLFMALTSGTARKEIVGKEFIARAVIGGISAIVGSLVCFVFFWPQFYFFRFSELTSVVNTFMDFTAWDHTVLINGQTYASDQVPWFYTMTYILISMPLILVILTAAGTVCGFLRRQPVIMASAVICYGILAEQALTGTRAYNGYRHFLFLVPLFSLIAAYPAALLTEASGHKLLRFAAIGAITIGLLSAVIEMAQLFPYEYSYYNMIVGGLQGADGKYYVDVWRSADREAFDAIEKLADNRPVVRVFSCGSPVNAMNRPRIQRVTQLQDADYIIELRRSCLADDIQGLPIAAEVRRQGVLFATVYTVK